jgi:hypothetical protein
MAEKIGRFLDTRPAGRQGRPEVRVCLGVNRVAYTHHTDASKVRSRVALPG